MSMKNSSDTIWNWTRALVASSAVPQPTEPPRTAKETTYCTEITCCNVTVNFFQRRESIEALRRVYGMLSHCCTEELRLLAQRHLYICVWGGPQTLFRSRATWWNLLPSLILTFMALHYRLHHMHRHIRQYNQSRTNQFFSLLCPCSSWGPTVSLLLMAAREGA